MNIMLKWFVLFLVIAVSSVFGTTYKKLVKKI
jgi:hypothetical protein